MSRLILHTFDPVNIERAWYDACRELHTDKEPSEIRVNIETFIAVRRHAIANALLDDVTGPGISVHVVPVIVDTELSDGEVELRWTFKKTYRFEEDR